MVFHYAKKCHTLFSEPHMLVTRPGVVAIPIETGNTFLLTFDLLINVQATRSELLGTNYTHSQANLKTWMDIITLYFCSVYLSTDTIIFCITKVFFCHKMCYAVNI